MPETIYVQVGNLRRPATHEEIEQLEKDRADAVLEQNRIEAEWKKKQDARKSALTKLAALGLTEEEAQALIH